MSVSVRPQRSSRRYQSALLRARRETSRPSTIPTCRSATSAVRRANPLRSTMPDPETPRSSSMTTTCCEGWWPIIIGTGDSRNISERVAELLAEREKIHGQATAVAIERVALTKTWVLDKLIENVDRAHRSRWSPRARGEGWWPIIRLIGLQGPLPRNDFNPLQIPTPET